MRKLLIGAALLALTVFGLGYVIGQVRGTTSSLAATSGPSIFNVRTFTHPWSSRWAGPRNALSGTKHADGTVTAVNGNTITVKPDGDTNSNEYSSVTTIVLNSSTQYSASGGKSAITVGSRIIATGSVSSDGKTLTASQILAGGAGGGNCPHGGSSNSTTPSGGSSGANA